ncbi:hypothetical protein ACIRCZ_19450 [Leifsonia sp. NPDC102414]|uniref:hypothetical protein n=1 Tax=Leifsonia sp. NPDC102414 TaxID=3364124 RepID=UPI0037F92622
MATLSPVSESGALDEIGLDVFESAVASCRGTVERILCGRAGNQDVDDVLQQLREILWRKLEAGLFDPTRGSLGGFAHGISVRVAAAALRRRPRTLPIPLELADKQTPVLEEMVRDFETTRLLKQVADVVGERAWAWALDHGLHGRTATEIADRAGAADRTVRDACQWVHEAAHTIAAAFEVATSNQMQDCEARAVWCFPAGTALAAVAAHLPRSQPATQIAACTGLPETTVRRALPRAERLRAAVITILEGR